MDKSKLITFSIITLLLINISTLTFMFLSGPNGHNSNRNPEPKNLIIKKLHFNENQIVNYEKTIEIHQKTIRNLDDSIRETKQELYQLLNSGTIDLVKKEALISKLADFQKQIETIHFNHFLEIKSICKKEQLSDYNKLTEELSKIFSQRPKPRHD